MVQETGAAGVQEAGAAGVQETGAAWVQETGMVQETGAAGVPTPGYFRGVATAVPLEAGGWRLEGSLGGVEPQTLS